MREKWPAEKIAQELHAIMGGKKADLMPLERLGECGQLFGFLGCELCIDIDEVSRKPLFRALMRAAIEEYQDPENGRLARAGLELIGLTDLSADEIAEVLKDSTLPPSVKADGYRAKQVRQFLAGRHLGRISTRSVRDSEAEISKALAAALWSLLDKNRDRAIEITAEHGSVDIPGPMSNSSNATSGEAMPSETEADQATPITTIDSIVTELVEPEEPTGRTSRRKVSVGSWLAAVALFVVLSVAAYFFGPWSPAGNSKNSQPPVILTSGQFSYPYDAVRELKGDGSSIWTFDVRYRDRPYPNQGMSVNFVSSQPVAEISLKLAYSPDATSCALDMLWRLKSSGSGVIEASGRLSHSSPNAKVDVNLIPSTREFQLSADFDWQQSGPGDLSAPKCDRAFIVASFDPISPA